MMNDESSRLESVVFKTSGAETREKELRLKILAEFI